ncbi:unnamed protein product, partial [Iphiclides podalirius]
MSSRPALASLRPGEIHQRRGARSFALYFQTSTLVIPIRGEAIGDSTRSLRTERTPVRLGTCLSNQMSLKANPFT